MHRVKRLAILLALAVALIIGLSRTSAQAENKAQEKPLAGAEAEKIVERTVSTAEARATDNLWTRDERLKSEALAWPDAPDKDAIEDEDDTISPGSPSISPGTKPNPKADAEAEALFAEAWKDIEMADEAAERAASGTRQVFTRYRGNYNTSMWTSHPWRAVGKLHFRTASGSNSYCTASVISNRVIVTAAHCLYGRGSGWHTNVSFVPAERYGSAPYGSFSASSSAILNGYITNGGRRYDVGVVVLNNNNSGRPVSYYTGTLGRSWNFGYTQNLHSIGYASNLSTQYTHICTAESFYAGYDVLAKGCDMTYGSSGGPWIKNYAPYQWGSNNYVNSVVSGPYTTPSEATFVGPRFSSNNIVPLCNWASC